MQLEQRALGGDADPPGIPVRTGSERPDDGDGRLAAALEELEPEDHEAICWPALDRSARWIGDEEEPSGVEQPSRALRDHRRGTEGAGRDEVERALDPWLPRKLLGGAFRDLRPIEAELTEHAAEERTPPRRGFQQDRSTRWPHLREDDAGKPPAGAEIAERGRGAASVRLPGTAKAQRVGDLVRDGPRTEQPQRPRTLERPCEARVHPQAGLITT